MSNEAWVWTLVALYWAYGIYWGIRGAIVSKTASGYMIGGRQIPMVVFILAATATSFSGRTFIGHPGLIWRMPLRRSTPVQGPRARPAIETRDEGRRESVDRQVIAGEGREPVKVGLPEIWTFGVVLFTIVFMVVYFGHVAHESYYS